MTIIAKETFSNGIVSMFKGEIREIADGDPEYTALLEEGLVEEYSAGGGGSGGLFIVDIIGRYDETAKETIYSASKTYAEIEEALTNGKTICARDISSTRETIMYLTIQDKYTHQFEFHTTSFEGNATDGYYIDGYNVLITSDNVVTYEWASKTFSE
jgi:hypothetical protein